MPFFSAIELHAFQSLNNGRRQSKNAILFLICALPMLRLDLEELVALPRWRSGRHQYKIIRYLTREFPGDTEVSKALLNAQSHLRRKSKEMPSLELIAEEMSFHIS